MASACTTIEIDDITCLSHVLQLPIKDAILFKEIQLSLKLPQHKIIQDVVTRWNSTFYMLERILEQKSAIITFHALHSPKWNLYTDREWLLITEIVEILRPIEKFTRLISADNASISIYLPIVKTVIVNLRKVRDNSNGLVTMISALLKGMEERFKNIEKNHKLLVSTCLDPRFQVRFNHFRVELDIN